MDSSSADPDAASAAVSAAADASVSVTPEQQQKDQLATCWAAATAADATNDPSFDVFVALASAAEKTGDAAEVVRALELLLKRFPLCYGYWKKLAEARSRLSAGDDPAASDALVEASEVFERGLAHVGSTPELWLSFATKLISSGSSSSSLSKEKKEETEEKIRAVFERAVGESGDAWGAGPLWEAFAAWEAGLASEGEEGGEGGGPSLPPLPPSPAPRRAAAVLFRGACQPIRDAEVLRSRLHELASRHSVGELAASEEEAGAARAAARPAGEEGGGGGGGGGGEAAACAAWLQELEASSPELSRGLALRARRHPFEARIRRPYWNSRPLDADQLRAWWSLLDDAEGLLVPMPPPASAGAASAPAAAASGASAPHPRDAIDRLYRRCLVACAAYPEFWRRRARWLLDAAGGGGGDEGERPPAAAALEAARAAASAAADVHCRSRPEALLFASRLDEAAGDFDAAREKLVRTRDVVSPGLAAAAAAVAHLDRRRAISEFLSSAAAAATAKRGGKKASPAALEEEARRVGAAAARLCLSESIAAAEAADTAAARSCVAALSLQAAALTSDDGDVEAGRRALAKGLRAAPGEAAVWEAAATFEARWGGKAGGGGGGGAAAAAVAILQAAAAPPASAVPGLERAIAEARAELRKKKDSNEEKRESSQQGGGGENGGENGGEEKKDEAHEEEEEEEDQAEHEAGEVPLTDLPLPADAVRRARAAGFALHAPFTPPGWPSPLPEPALAHADRAALSARSVALAEASASAPVPALAGGGGNSGVALLRDAAALHDQRFGYAQAAAANIAAGAAPGGAGGLAGAKRPFVPGLQQQQQWQPRPRTFYPRPHYNPHWQQQQQQQQQQQHYQQHQQWQQYQQPPQYPQQQQQQQWAPPQNYQQP